MISMRKNPLLGLLEGSGHENLVGISGPKKSLDFQGPHLLLALVMDVARIKIITSGAI